MSSGLIYSISMYSKLLYSKLLNSGSTAIIPTIQSTTLPGVFYGNLCIVNNKTIVFCIVNNGIVNSGIVGALVHRVLYIIQPCQE